MFHLTTGTPGAGKTLNTLAKLHTITDRPIYYSNITDLKLPWTLIEDAANYHEQLPDNAIYVLDECQKVFPVRAPKDKVPPGLSFIETHRHRGIDIYFVTQHPSLLDHHARRLVGHHTHYQRNFGMKFSVEYTNNKLFDPTNYHELNSCEKSQVKQNKKIFELYKSAEVHTHKTKIPKTLYAIPPILALICWGIYTVFGIVKPDESGVIPSPVPTYTIGSNQAEISPKPVKNWQTAFIPAIPGVPYTAPIYEGMAKPNVMPIVSGCVTNEDETKCQCYTQQATRIDMTHDQCLANIKSSAFNPFKRDSNIEKMAFLDNNQQNHNGGE